MQRQQEVMTTDYKPCLICDRLALVSAQPAPPLDGTTISRLGIVTLTTSKGTVVWKNFGIANLPGTGDFGTKVDGVLAEYNNVDPVASTGIFAGATGIVFSTGFTKYNQQGYPIGFFGDVRGKVYIPDNADKR
ncbi:hypothetical protein A6770_14755 [Nostoc minutum NIES-26]|uniref:Uncharacterized protein n=1 Tax=Nostoc minutum NIES-26 TaxID=1844469 RepID=A0A367RND9_9NOSO|nr:hypothetical protein A6770_14755 [Nostoc minutum NIES-26]